MLPLRELHTSHPQRDPPPPARALGCRSFWIVTLPSPDNYSIGDDEEEEVDDNAVLGDGAEGVSRTAAGAAGADELPPELRMDDYDDEPGLTVTAARGEDGEEAGGGSDSDDDDDGGDAADGEPDAMEEDSDDEGGEGDEGDDENAEAMGVSLLEEPSTGQVFAYESEGEDSDTEDNIIKPGDHVLLTASTEEVYTVQEQCVHRVQEHCVLLCFRGPLTVSATECTATNDRDFRARYSDHVPSHMRS